MSGERSRAACSPRCPTGRVSGTRLSRAVPGDGLPRSAGRCLARPSHAPCSRLGGGGGSCARAGPRGRPRRSPGPGPPSARSVSGRRCRQSSRRVQRSGRRAAPATPPPRPRSGRPDPTRADRDALHRRRVDAAYLRGRRGIWSSSTRSAARWSRWIPFLRPRASSPRGDAQMGRRWTLRRWLRRCRIPWCAGRLEREMSDRRTDPSLLDLHRGSWSPRPRCARSAASWD